MSEADIFLALSDPSRRQILQLLAEKRRSINSLAENFEMSRPAVSKHVKTLHQSGFIEIEEVGRERYCSLKQDGFARLQEWIAYFDAFWLQRLEKLDDLLKKRS